MLAEIEAGGEMPLGYMLRVMRDESVPMAGRMEAAARAAPYCHAKLANVELTAAVQVEPPIDCRARRRIPPARGAHRMTSDAATTENVGIFVGTI
jgi:hypothetical protein